MTYDFNITYQGNKMKFSLEQALSLTSALGGGWVVNATPRPLYPQERPGTHCIGGWVRKISPPPGFYPRTVQLVANRYTDYANPAQNKM